MRFVALGLVAISWATATAEAQLTEQPTWSKRLTDTAITEARLVFLYSLTDDCELSEVSVRERWPNEFFDSDTVHSVVTSFVGPFGARNTNIAATDSADPKVVVPLSMTQRVIGWRTSAGHNYVVCQFTKQGKLSDAYFTDGHFAPSKSVADEQIRVPLSTLGPKLRSVTFTLAEGKVVKWDDGDT